jgi:two-component system, chemotaxis family, protein-glutamate methylesterase/glutaminase
LSADRSFARQTKQKTMADRDIIVIGTSAGGVEAPRELARGLPPDLAAAVFIVLYFPATSRSALSEMKRVV